MEFVKTLKAEANKTLTENGAVGFASSGQALLDFNFRLPSFRHDKEGAEKSLYRVLREKDPYLLKYLFYLRDPRGGAGERDTFRLAAKEAFMAVKDGEKLLALIPEYGRFDDLLAFEGTDLEEAAFKILKEQYEKDLRDMGENKPVSLLAKWLPSDNASSKRSRYLAHKLSGYFGISVRDYRASLVKLRSYLDVLEVKACASRWGEIDYNKVPSKANLRYRDAFLRHDEKRRRTYLDDLENGTEGTKINASVNFPHEIVHAYFEYNGWDTVEPKSKDVALEELWKNLPDLEGLGNTLVVRDGSGSMFDTIGYTSIMALDVADALSIYASERCRGPYKDTFITFSEKPEIVSLSGLTSLRDKLKEVRTYDDYTNTDLEATFDLILRTAVNGNLSQEDLPSQVLIVSDMEFDEAHVHAGRRNFRKKSLMEVIAHKFEAAGYKLPKLVFWNVNSRTNAIPTSQNELGVILVSGFSVHIFNMVASGELDPYKALADMLERERYKAIPLAEYL